MPRCSDHLEDPIPLRPFTLPDRNARAPRPSAHSVFPVARPEQRADWTPAASMRRRPVIAAVVLDGLSALAAPALPPSVGAGEPQAAHRYAEVAGVCVERLGLEGEPATVSGRPVDGSLCG